tara:strand:- start:248 stop:490 length:243 start_codon:yes stop_codon:yes gene_type:complete
VIVLKKDHSHQYLFLNQSAEEAEKIREIYSFGGFVEPPNLLDDSFSGDGFNGKTDHQAQHGCATVELFAENLLRIRGVGG